MADGVEDMRQIPPRVAVCVIRAERQGAGMLVTLVITADIEEASNQRLHVTDIDTALETVRRFLLQFSGSAH